VRKGLIPRASWCPFPRSGRINLTINVIFFFPKYLDYKSKFLKANKN
jgi:hypothetical protein